MLKYFSFLFIINCFQPLIGQNLKIDKSKIVSVEQSTYYFKVDKNHNTSKRRKWKTALKTYIFDRKGFLLQKTEFGKHHNYDLKLIDNISIYHYNGNLNVDSTEEWHTDYSKNILLKYYGINKFDSLNNVISYTHYFAKTDSVTFQCNYFYTDNLLKKMIISNEIIELEYDSVKRIIQRTYINAKNDSIRYKSTYLYSNDTVYSFFSQGSPDNLKPSNITVYNDNGQICCSLPANETNIKGVKRTYEYSSEGFLTRVNYFRLIQEFNTSDSRANKVFSWNHEYYIQMKINNRNSIDNFEAIKRLNLSILEEL